MALLLGVRLAVSAGIAGAGLVLSRSSNAKATKEKLYQWLPEKLRKRYSPDQPTAPRTATNDDVQVTEDIISPITEEAHPAAGTYLTEDGADDTGISASLLQVQLPSQSEGGRAIVDDDLIPRPAQLQPNRAVDQVQLDENQMNFALEACVSCEANADLVYPIQNHRKDPVRDLHGTVAPVGISGAALQPKSVTNTVQPDENQESLAHDQGVSLSGKATAINIDPVPVATDPVPGKGTGGSFRAAIKALKTLGEKVVGWASRLFKLRPADPGPNQVSFAREPDVSFSHEADGVQFDPVKECRKRRAGGYFRASGEKVVRWAARILKRCPAYLDPDLRITVDHGGNGGEWREEAWGPTAWKLDPDLRDKIKRISTKVGYVALEHVIFDVILKCNFFSKESKNVLQKIYTAVKTELR